MSPITLYQVFSFVLPFVIGLFILLERPRNVINRIFFFLSLVITGYAGANFLIEYQTFTLSDPTFAYKLAIFFASLNPPALVLFSWYFPRLNSKVTIGKTLFVWGIALFFTSFSFSNFYVKNIDVLLGIRFIDFGFLYSVFAINFCILVGYSFFHLLNVYNNSESKVEKKQIKIVLIGLVISYSVGSVFSLLLPVFFRYSVTEFIGPIGPLILVLFMAYAITKLELMDIRVAITRSVAYGIVGLLLIASFFGLNFFPMPTLILMIANASLGIFWAFVARRIRTFIQTPLEEKWITDFYDSDKLVNKIAKSLAPIIEKEDACQLI
ncbi:MAG: hypothetical protein ABIH69_06640, partial [bacterium]